jgi:hypothetical protein
MIFATKLEAGRWEGPVFCKDCDLEFSTEPGRILAGAIGMLEEDCFAPCADIAHRRCDSEIPVSDGGLYLTAPCSSKGIPVADKMSYREGRSARPEFARRYHHKDYHRTEPVAISSSSN